MGWCDSRKKCCDMGIKKIELFVQTKCRSTVQLATVGRKSLAWSFTDNVLHGRVFTTFKLPRVNLDRHEIGWGFDMCITLREPCDRLEDFCFDGPAGSCRASFFSQNEACCPTGYSWFHYR